MDRRQAIVDPIQANGRVLQLPPLLRRYVREIDRRTRRGRLLRAVGAAGAFFVTWALCCALADRLIQFSSPIRLTLLLSGAGVALAILIPPLRSVLNKQTDWRSAASLAERHDHALRGRLLTVTSQLQEPARHRGSPEMLASLLDGLEEQAYKSRRTPPRPAARFIGPWLALTAISLLIAAGTRWRPVEADQLSRRFFFPFAGVPPVTSTQLTVATGDCAVAQSGPLQLRASVRSMHDEPVTIHWTDDANSWCHATMAPAAEAEGEYRFNFDSVDRDLRYYVRAGDAASRIYAVRVLRQPSVAEYRLRYVYPAYTGLPPLTVNSTDGVVEAPVGTQVEVLLSATESLASAALHAPDGAKTEFQEQGDNRHFRTQLIVRADVRYEAILVSTRNARSRPITLHVHAIPDLHPMVRLQPSGHLRLNPSDILLLPYQAIDDYGLAEARVTAQVNGQEVAQIPVPAGGRRLEGVCQIDLTTLPVHIGDTLTLTFTAADGQGQRGNSEPAQITIAPRSIDLAAYRRIAELTNAAELADGLADQLSAASSALEEAERQREASMDSSATLARSNRHLTGSAEAAALLRQTLLRTMVQSRAPQFSITLERWIDAAQVIAFDSEDLFRRNGVPSGMGSEARDQLRASSVRANELRDHLRVISQGEQATALLADRENLAAARASDAAPAEASQKERMERLSAGAARARQEIDAGARRIGLNPAAPDLDDRLRERSAAAAALLAGVQPIDLAQAAREWATQVSQDAAKPRNLSGRLSTAAQAEAVRSDADLQRAYDLQLAARAASRLQTILAAPPWATGETLDARVPTQYAQALADVAGDERPRGAALERGDSQSAARRSAEAARNRLKQWAGEVAANQGYGIAAAPAQDMALRAGAQSVARDYTGAAQTDRDLYSRLLNESPYFSAAAARLEQNFQQVERAMSRAQRLDRLEGEQATLIAGDEPTASTDTASKQQNVAEAIAKMARPAPRAAASIDDDPDWRERAATALVAAQETLAKMPQQFSQAQEALASQRRLSGRAQEAQAEAASEQWTDAERQTAAQRAAEQASQDAADAAGRTAQSLAPVSPAEVRSLTALLEPFVPETSGAVFALGQQLAPALQDLERQSGAGDLAAAQRALEQARQALTFVQREVTRAQESYTQRDPLAAARSFARAAAVSLTRQPPDLPGAQKHQANTSTALSMAWDQSIHEAAAFRLASLPVMQNIYESPAPNLGAASSAAALAPAKPGLLPLLSFMSERGWAWGKDRPQASPELAPAPQADPPGYEESLRLYFDALGRAQGSGSAEPPAR